MFFKYPNYKRIFIYVCLYVCLCMYKYKRFIFNIQTKTKKDFFNGLYCLRADKVIFSSYLNNKLTFLCVCTSIVVRYKCI